MGHLPVSNYHTHHIDNRLIIDESKKIISIDGGMGVKELGQLNALIIEDGIYKSTYVLPFPTVKITNPYYPGISHHHKVAWPNYEVEIIKKGDEFTLCKKVYNQEELMIKNEYLTYQNDKVYCFDDYEAYHLAVDIGDEVYYIKTCGNYAYVIKEHEIGWIKKDCIL